MSKYARVGKAPLIRAIGIQKNHKEIIYKEDIELDRVQSGCFSCPNYKNIDYLEYLPDETKAQVLHCCKNCPHATYKKVIHETYKYVNEKNMYGNTPRLKAIALKLLMVYHFLKPDENGFIKNVSIKELAALLHCTSRSIKNANATLQDYKYIIYGHTEHTDFIQLILPEYSSYALPANQGGRGYSTINIGCLNEILKIQDLNQLRIFLRVVLEIDTNKKEDTPVISKEFSFFRRFLPQYCKPGVIRSALSHVSKLFSISYQENTISLKMDPAYHGRKCFENSNTTNKKLIQEYITILNTTIQRVNDNIIHKGSLDPYDIKLLSDSGITQKSTTVSKQEFFSKFSLKDTDFRDLALLCTTFSFETVKESLSYIYNHYIAFSKPCNIGALARTILKYKDSNTSAISLAL